MTLAEVSWLPTDISREIACSIRVRLAWTWPIRETRSDTTEWYASFRSSGSIAMPPLAAFCMAELLTHLFRCALLLVR
jgi:hypothetical protein